MRSPIGAAITTISVDHQTPGLLRPWGSHPAAGWRTLHRRLASHITPRASQRAKVSPEAPIAARIRARADPDGVWEVGSASGNHCEKAQHGPDDAEGDVDLTEGNKCQSNEGAGSGSLFCHPAATMPPDPAWGRFPMLNL